MKTVLFLFFLVPISAFAGGTSGGGGKGVVCTNYQGDETIELLDLWEASTLFGYNPQTFPTGTSLKTAVEILIDRLQFIEPPSVYNFASCALGAPCVKNSLLREVSKFLLPSPNVIRLYGVDLEETDDSFEIAKPANCKIKQIVNYYDDSHIYIDQSRFNKLNLLNQAALIVHEALYKYLRFQDAETNSIRTRRAIGFVSAGNSFEDKSLIQKPASYISCESIDLKTNRTNYWLLFWKSNSLPGDDSLQVLPLYFGGSTLLGITNWNQFKTLSGASALYEYIETGKCQNFSWSVKSYLVYGPVEFDRELWIGLTCDASKSAFNITAKNISPGSKQWSDIETLQCSKVGFY